MAHFIGTPGDFQKERAIDRHVTTTLCVLKLKGKRLQYTDMCAYLRRSSGCAVPERTAFFALIAVCTCALIATPHVWAATHSLTSGRVTVDTRAATTATLMGRLITPFGNPISNGTIEVGLTTLSGKSGSDGRFSVSNVPYGDDYRLGVAAPGCFTRFYPGISIRTTVTNVGDLVLDAVTGGMSVVRLVPDVNPSVSSIEDGGTVFRYYQVVTTNGLPVPLATVTVRRKGGTDVPQFDISDLKRISGISDLVGMVRLRVPASIMPPNGIAEYEVLLDSTVQQTFQTARTRRCHDRVAKLKVGSGIGGKIKVFKGNVSGAFSSEVRQQVFDGVATNLLIRRQRAGELGLGVDLGGGIKIAAGTHVSAGAGVYVGADVAYKFAFDPRSTDPAENAMKLYVLLSDPILGGAQSVATTASGQVVGGLASAFIEKVRNDYEAQYLATNLRSCEAHVRAGAYAKGIADIGAGAGKSVMFGVQGEVSGKLGIVGGYGRSFVEPRDEQFKLGLEAATSASVRAGGFGKLSSGKGSGPFVGVGFGLAGEAELLGVGVRRQGRLSAVDLDASIEAEANLCIGWEDLFLLKDLAIDEDRIIGVSDSYHLDLFSTEYQEGDVPTILRDLGRGVMANIDENLPNSLGDAFLQAALFKWAEYERKVYLAEKAELGLDITIDPVVAGLYVQLEGSVEKGTEFVAEKGKLLRGQWLASEVYPAAAEAWIAETSDFISQVNQYALHAAGPIGEAYQRFSELVSAAGAVVETAGHVANSVQATLAFGAGVLAEGSHVVCDTAAGLTTLSGASISTGTAPHERGVLGECLALLPPTDGSNYVYGIGGFVRFACTNAFSGTGTVSIAYSDAAVAGLDESALAMYRYDDVAKRWTHLGGTVFPASNIVSCMVSSLGVFTLAPPLPTGILALTPNLTVLPADGVSQMEVVASNLVLNTGAPATQQWAFTVSTLGVDALDADVRTNTPGLQVASTGGVVRVHVRASTGTLNASVALQSVAGDASGQLGIPITDDAPPAQPTGIIAVAGQSRIWVTWSTNGAEGVDHYQIHYQAGAAGPPYVGTAAVEGVPSPVTCHGNATLLRGLKSGTNYFVAVSAVDESGNESALSAAIEVTTAEQPPHPPQGVAVAPDDTGKCTLMWEQSEDDGYNDRDVDHYAVYRRIMPDGAPQKVGAVPAGGNYFENSPGPLASNRYVVYTVVSAQADATESTSVIADHMLLNGGGVDNDWDGLPDLWEAATGLSPSNRLDGASIDSDNDGMDNGSEYVAGTHPRDPTSYFAIDGLDLSAADVVLHWPSVSNRLYSVLASTNLAQGFAPYRTSVSPTPPSNSEILPSAAVTNRMYFRLEVHR